MCIPSIKERFTDVPRSLSNVPDATQGERITSVSFSSRTSYDLNELAALLLWNDANANGTTIENKD